MGIFNPGGGSGGAVDSVTASNSTLTISPTTGAVLAAVNQGANFSWTGTHGFSLDITVPHEAYGVAWNGSNEVPTKDALYDKINSLAPGGVTSVSNSDGTLTVSPTTGNVVASVNQAFDFHWTGLMDFGNYIHTIYGLSSNQGGAGVLLFDGTQTRLADDNGIVIDGGFVQMQNYGIDFLYCDGATIAISLPVVSVQSLTAPAFIAGDTGGYDGSVLWASKSTGQVSGRVNSPDDEAYITLSSAQTSGLAKCGLLLADHGVFLGSIVTDGNDSDKLKFFTDHPSNPGALALWFDLLTFQAQTQAIRLQSLASLARWRNLTQQ